MWVGLVGFVLTAGALSPAAVDPGKLPPAADIKVDFARDVQPIFAEFCHKCHGEEKSRGSLRLHDKAAAFEGGDRGPAFIPGKSAESTLIQAVSGLDEELVMPPKGDRLTAKQVGVLRAWIDQGAKWPDAPATDKPKPNEGKKKGKTVDHWAFQPIRRPDEPALRNWNWVRNPIDEFVLARLEAEGIEPSPEADRATLVRRLSLDLTGLPPTPEQVDAFLSDDSDEAYDRVVDELLASPHYGEHWGRHWLDLARYADSDGYEKDNIRPHAWRYRNWVIDAFNRDLPFDRFTIEQLAGDLLPNPTLDQKVATGFHRNTLTNTEGGVDQEEYRVRAVVDRVNTTGTVWLGLTVNCVECHTHKYDQIEHREYYRLFAFFNSSNEVNVPAPLPAETTAYEQAKAAFDKAHAPLVAAVSNYKPKLAAKLPAWEKSLGDTKVTWTPLDPVGFVSAGGASFTKRDDGSLVVGGNRPIKDKYTVVATTKLEGITGFRLETLTEPSLPRKGPGRTDSGNFVLSEFTAQSAPLADPSSAKPVPFDGAHADREQDGFAIASATDGKPKTGWAIGAGDGDTNTDRSAVFVAKDDVGLDGGTTLTFTLDQQYGSAHTIGRFRLLATTTPRKALRLPDRVRAALAVPAEKRTQKQQPALTEYYGTIDPEMVRLTQTVLEHDKQAPKPPNTQAQVIAERDPTRKTHVHIRGDFLRKGAEVQPGTLEVLHAFEPRNGQPDRIDLAHWLLDPANPLTRRVTVNRIWQHLFGQGLVTTVEDFGTRGEPPTHPKLLDWLATELSDRGWSTKEMIRHIVRSATYRQSSHARPELVDRDPKNLLLARQNRLRLSAETVRDAYLAASGLLSRRIGGPSVRPPLPGDVAALGYANSVKWKESPGADKYRRGMYIFFQRTVPYPMLTTFDAPDSNVTCARRERSNTPLQALTLLNDPVFVECAQALAKRATNEANGATDTRIRRLIRLCLGRVPADDEVARLVQLRDEIRTLCRQNSEATVQLAGNHRPEGVEPADAAAWTAVARTVLNLDEFITRE